MKRTLLILAAMLRVCWGPEANQCGDFLGRLKTTAGAEQQVIDYYVVRLNNGTVALIEPDLIIDINRKGKP